MLAITTALTMEDVRVFKLRRVGTRVWVTKGPWKGKSGKVVAVHDPRGMRRRRFDVQLDGESRLLCFAAEEIRMVEGGNTKL